MIVFFVLGGYEFLKYDINNVLYSIGCTLSNNVWKLFLLHKPLIRSFENLSGIDVVSVDNDPKFFRRSVTTSTFEVFMGYYYSEDTQSGQHRSTKLLAYCVQNFKNRNLIRSNE